MVLNYAVIIGMMKCVLYDNMEGSPIRREVQEIFVEKDNYILIEIVPYAINGVKEIGTKPAMVANCVTHSYCPDEIFRID